MNPLLGALLGAAVVLQAFILFHMIRGRREAEKNKMAMTLFLARQEATIQQSKLLRHQLIAETEVFSKVVDELTNQNHQPDGPMVSLTK